MNRNEFLRRQHIPRAQLTCAEMKATCGTDTDPIGYYDWCDINPTNYIEPGVLNPRQCYELSTLIMTIETRLRSELIPLNPLTNEILTNQQLMLLAAQHIVNGNHLPPHFDARIMELTEDLQRTIRMRAHRGELRRIARLRQEFADNPGLRERRLRASFNSGREIIIFSEDIDVPNIRITEELMDRFAEEQIQVLEIPIIISAHENILVNIDTYRRARNLRELTYMVIDSVPRGVNMQYARLVIWMMLSDTDRRQAIAHLRALVEEAPIQSESKRARKA